MTIAATQDIQAEESAEIVAGPNVAKIIMACAQSDNNYYVRIPLISYDRNGTLTLNEDSDSYRGKFVIGEVNLSNSSAVLKLTENGSGAQPEIGTISGTMKSLDVEGYYNMYDGGISAQIERLTVTGGMTIWTANSSFEAVTPSLPGIANTQEIYVSGYLSVMSGNNNASGTQSPAAIVLPTGGKIVVENGGELIAYGADGSYGGNRSGPGVRAKGSAYIRVGDDASFISQRETPRRTQASGSKTHAPSDLGRMIPLRFT